MNVHYDWDGTHLVAVGVIMLINIGILIATFVYAMSNDNARRGDPVSPWQMVPPALVIVVAAITTASGALGVNNPEWAALEESGFQVIDQPDSDEDFYYVITPDGENASVFVYEFQDDWYNITATAGEL